MNRRVRLIGGLSLILAIDLVMAGNPAKIDFQWNYKQRVAQTLFEKKDYPGAQKALEELVATAPDEQAKAVCLSLIARTLACQGQYDLAVQKAQSIADKSLADYTRMEMMTVSGKQAELIATFKDAQISNWPEMIAYKGFLKRGEAYRATTNDQAAVADLEQAADRVKMDTKLQEEILNQVGALYKRLKDPVKALDAYRTIIRIVGEKGVSYHDNQYPSAVLAAARMLKERKEYDEALGYLSAYDPYKGPAWGCVLLDMSGDIYAAKGQKDKALAKYQEAGKIAALHNFKSAKHYNNKSEKFK